MNRHIPTLTTMMLMLGTSSVFAQPNTTSDEKSSAIIIMKDANGADRKCVIERTWRLSDGTQAQLVRDVQSNETMTICDKAPSEAALQELSQHEKKATATAPSSSNAAPARLSPSVSGSTPSQKSAKPTTWLGRLFTRSSDTTPTTNAPPLAVTPVNPSIPPLTAAPTGPNAPVAPLTPVAPMAPATAPRLTPVPTTTTTQPSNSSGFRLFRWMQRSSTPTSTSQPPAGSKLPANLRPINTAPSRVLVSPSVQSTPVSEVQQWLSVLNEGLLPSHREEAAEMLASDALKDHPEVVPALLRAAQQDPANSVRTACIRCLALLKPEQPASEASTSGPSTPSTASNSSEAK